MNKEHKVKEQPTDDSERIAETGCYHVIEMLDAITKAMRESKDQLHKDGIAYASRLIDTSHYISRENPYYPPAFWIAVLIASIYRSMDLTIPVRSADRLMSELPPEKRDELIETINRSKEAMAAMDAIKDLFNHLKGPCQCPNCTKEREEQQQGKAE